MRHYNVGQKATEWNAETDQGTTCWDLCKRCGVKAQGKPAADLNFSVSTYGEPLDTVSEGEFAMDYKESAASGFVCECEICGRVLRTSDS